MNFENEQYYESEGELMPYEGGNEHVNAEYAEYEEIDAPEILLSGKLQNCRRIQPEAL